MQDVVIIGGGPAGLSAAIMAAQAGLSCTIFEQHEGIIDKACGEGLMPSAVRTLEDMGVNIPTKHPFHGIRYIDGPSIAQGCFPGGTGQGVRRIVLHEAMHTRAAELGVQWVHQRARKVEQNDQYVTVEGVQARYAFAADGLFSPMRKRLGLQLPAKRATRLGLRRHYPIKPWSSFVEVYWSPHAEAYVTPVADDLVGVAVLFYKEHAPHQNKYEQLLSLFPELQSRLPDPTTILRGSGPFEQRSKTPVAGRILLIGDAAGYLDPLTGEGIRLGLSTAKAAVECVVANQPSLYAKKWRAATRRYWWMTDGLLRLRKVPFLRRLMIPTLRRSPWLFGQILGALAHD